MSNSEYTPRIPSVPDDKRIWRYRDFTQFLSIIEHESLWFNRSDRFSDSFEGSVPRANIEARELSNKYGVVSDKLLDKFSATVRKVRECSYLNCWHINEHESAAMWDLYLPADKGIAIQSTVGQFRNAINEAENNVIIAGDDSGGETGERERIMITGKVNYIDYSNNTIPENNIFAPLYHKRQSYEHENEFRASYTKFYEMKDLKGNVATDADFTTAPGRYIEVNIDELIESIYISPTAPEWFFDLVDSVMHRYNIDIDIQRSNLDQDPVF